MIYNVINWETYATSLSVGNPPHYSLKPTKRIVRKGVVLSNCSEGDILRGLLAVKVREPARLPPSQSNRSLEKGMSLKERFHAKLLEGHFCWAA